MLVTLWVFIGSGLVGGLLVSLKMAGVQGSSIPGWEYIRTKGDLFFDQKIAEFKKFTSRFEKSTIQTAGKSAFEKGKSGVNLAKETLAKHGTPFTDMIKGKRRVEILNSRRPSKFLHDIKKSKEDEENRQPLV